LLSSQNSSSKTWACLRVWKTWYLPTIQNFLQYLEEKFRSYFVPGQSISVDERTVSFKGLISFKTYNPKKPTKWGMRICVLADSATGYIYMHISSILWQTYI
jgi:hypothetical protein